MDRWTSFIGRIRPYSLSALLVAVACLGLATPLQFGLGLIGVSWPFGTFYPAVLVAALLAGVPAGVAVILGGSIITWWAFIPPSYEFSELTRVHAANFLVFLVSSTCIVALAQWHRDVLRRLQERDRERDLLMQELEHRGRNTYAVVNSIVRNTLRNDRVSADAIVGRVRAVSSANDLINESSAETVRLHTLLALEFAPNAEARLRTSGPDVALSPDAARKLGLVFHELTTNAMKHGALATPEGRVTASWKADADKLHLSWKEENGPAVSPPQRGGFGTTIVTESLKSLDGDISLVFDPDGLRCAMRCSYR